MTPPTAADDTRGPGHAPARAGADAPVTAAAARARVSDLLEQAGVSLAGVAAADALLATSELVTNAIRHGGGITAMTSRVADGMLHLSVSDADPRPPAARSGSPEQPGGFGWPLIQHLAQHVSVSTHTTGKTISITLRLA
ncbi:ATP-binding protein [Streptomyces subrutilus]|uniref:ATP-binding protein n=1 Tax=Streptomyces subrutilus TaxID=36818 RepID=UPI0034041121